MRMVVTIVVMSLGLLPACTADKPQIAEKEDKALEFHRIMMSREAQEHVGLQVAAALPQQLREYLRVTGTVQPIDAKVGEVRPIARGRLEEVMVHIGDRVADGQTLARFD